MHLAFCSSRCLQRFQFGRTGFCEGWSWAEAPDGCEVALRGGRARAGLGWTGSRGVELRWQHSVSVFHGLLSFSSPGLPAPLQPGPLHAGVRRPPPQPGLVRGGAGVHGPGPGVHQDHLEVRHGAPGRAGNSPAGALSDPGGRGDEGAESCAQGGTCCPRALRLQGCPWASAAPAGFVSPLRVFACGCVLAGVCLRTGEAAAFFPGLTEAVETSSQPPRPRGGESCPLSGSEGWGGMAET